MRMRIFNSFLHLIKTIICNNVQCYMFLFMFCEIANIRTILLIKHSVLITVLCLPLTLTPLIHSWFRLDSYKLHLFLISFWWSLNNEQHCQRWQGRGERSWHFFPSLCFSTVTISLCNTASGSSQFWSLLVSHNTALTLVPLALGIVQYPSVAHPQCLTIPLFVLITCPMLYTQSLHERFIWVNSFSVGILPDFYQKL